MASLRRKRPLVPFVECRFGASGFVEAYGNTPAEVGHDFYIQANGEKIKMTYETVRHNHRTGWEWEARDANNAQAERRH